MKRLPLHARQIKIEAFEIDNDRIVVVGNLDDAHTTTLHTPNGRVFPAGVIHDMRLELEVSLPDLTITAVRVSMAQAPEPGCQEVIPDMQVLVGLQVMGGFTHEVRRRLGGPRGCAHLVTLVIAMAPVVIQAAATSNKAKAVVATSLLQQLVNSCRMWREGGVYETGVREQLANLPRGDEPER